MRNSENLGQYSAMIILKTVDSTRPCMEGGGGVSRNFLENERKGIKCNNLQREVPCIIILYRDMTSGQKPGGEFHRKSAIKTREASHKNFATKNKGKV